MSRSEMRRGARLSAVQALYEMEIGGRGVVEAMSEFEAFWIGKEVEDIEPPRPRSPSSAICSAASSASSAWSTARSTRRWPPAGR